MAIPVNETFSGALGATLYLGRAAPALGRPAWRTAMTINTWANLPGAAFSTFNPELNPAINPGFGGTSPWHASNGFAGKSNAWCGRAWDEATGTLWAPLDGGHADWGGNEPFRSCLFVDTPTWDMLRNPSGSLPGAITINDGAEATGLFTADGKLRPGHSYNNNVYVPGVGPVVTRGEFVYLSGQAGFKRAYKIHETTGEATLLCDWSALAGAGSGTGGATYDASRHCVWFMGTGNAGLMKLDMTTNVATVALAANNYNNNYARLVYLPTIDMVAVFHNGGGGYLASKFYLIDVANGFTIIQPTLTGSYSAGLNLNGQVGADWDGTKFGLWNNSTNRTEISTLTPTGNPRTAPWAWGVMTVGGSNAVTPTTAMSNGTFSRFGHSTKLGGWYLQNAVSDAISLFADV